MIRQLAVRIRNVLPFIAIGVALDSHRMGREARQARLEQVTNEATRLANEILEKHDIIASNQITKNKIVGLSSDVSSHLDSATHNTRVISELVKNRLNDPNLSKEELESVLKLLKDNTDQKIDSLEKANKILQDVIDLASSGNSKKNDYINQFNVLIEKYKDFLSTLSVEQIAAIVNILGYIIIISSIISIAAVLYGDFLIRYFKLEERFPKLAVFISIRRKFQRYYLNYNFIVILLISLFLIWWNIQNLFY
uniref:LAGLIDADG endonuclease n=1 Tax=Clavaria fumosa TaxID=264083 RepID=A0A7T3PCZ8_9AGAR|nr:hypothetical protein KQ422_mgp033 [Clavaria fumosa]QPZ51167.1 hypothetical protein [Clavaria fumosa]